MVDWKCEYARAHMVIWLVYSIMRCADNLLMLLG